ncbi:TonB-dependent receptor [Mesoflavibacter zeaxanthinifaciens]|uniref:TonB-dependent receptor n=1 Tax=Mesoflavibacter zeaxanthinifaciens TaxID=393060 RepID=UPI003A8D406F
MKKTIFIFFFSFFFQISAQAQEKISLKIDNQTLEESINLIETNSQFKFFYITSWIDNSIRITENFIDTDVKIILSKLFDNTDLNYFIFEETKIILTKNSKIHSSLYVESTVTKDTVTELYIEKTKPIYTTNNDSNTTNSVIKIGKESTTGYRNEYRLSGYVTNKTTKTPIPNLVLLIKDKNIFTSTNDKGYYSFRIPFGYNEIETILLGYEKSTTRVIMYNNGTLDFSINENSQSLDEVVIEANVKQNVKAVISGVNQIKIEEVKVVPQVLGERDLLKIATTLPGVVSAGEGSDGVNVRGGKTDQNLFLLDKSVLYNPTHFLGLFSAINPFTTKDFNVYKGNVPAEFGGRISSVFDISTKKSSVEEFSGEASLSPVTSNVALNIPIVKEKSGLIVGVRSTYSNWLLKLVKDEKLKNSSAFFFDAIAKYNHIINKNNSITASGYYSTDSYSIASDSTNTYNNKILSADWNHRFNDKSYGNLSISNSSYNFTIDFEGNANKNFKLDYKIDEVNVKLKMNYDYSAKHKFDYGIATKLYNVNPGTINPKGNESIITSFNVQKERALESAAFVSDEFSINKKLSFNFGARYNVYAALGKSKQRIYKADSPINDASVIRIDEYKANEVYKTYQGLSLRFSTRYSINEELSIKASLHNSYQFIHRLTNNTLATPTDTWKLSDANIEPQKAIQASLGIYKNIDGDLFEISLESYYKQYENIINYKVGASLLLNEFIETEVLQGPGKSYGVEFLLRKNKGDLNGWLSYSYSRSFLKLDSNFPTERVNGGKDFPTNYDKPHNLNLILNYKLTKRFSLSSNFTFQSGRPITYPSGKYSQGGNNFILYSDVNKYRVPNYYRLDIGFNAEGNHKLNKIGHSFWNFSIYNVLGRNNPYSVFFVTENGEIKAYQSSIFSTPIPTITYNFKF